MHDYCVAFLKMINKLDEQLGLMIFLLKANCLIRSKIILNSLKSADYFVAGCRQ